MAVAISRGEVHLVNLDATIGSEVRKTRPCVVVSPDEMNHSLRTVIVAPMASKGRSYPTRIPWRFDGTAGHVVLDQLRTVDTLRLVRRLGRLPGETLEAVLAALGEMFAP